MSRRLLLLTLSWVLPVTLGAVYAPIPEQEQGKALSFELEGGAYYDSNIFGASTNEQDSLVYKGRGRAKYNASVTDQTFFSAFYDLTYRHFDDRPGDKNLLDHRFNAKLDHAFQPNLKLAVEDTFSIIDNPASAVVGTGALQTNQSYMSNIFDSKLMWDISERWGVDFKYRNTWLDYDDQQLSNQLSRWENLLGVAGRYKLRPRLTLVGEYRYQDNDYFDNTPPKDNRSHIVLGGVDYQMGRQVLMQGRAGVEMRDRESANSDTTRGWGQLTGVYRYTEQSYVSLAVQHALREPPDTVNYTDELSTLLQANIEHYLTAMIAWSGSASVNFGTLEGRPGVADADETTWRLGTALTYMPTKNWAIIGRYDYDDVSSDVPTREQVRHRVGLSARYSF